MGLICDNAMTLDDLRRNDRQHPSDLPLTVSMMIYYLFTVQYQQSKFSKSLANNFSPRIGILHLGDWRNFATVDLGVFVNFPATVVSKFSAATDSFFPI